MKVGSTANNATLQESLSVARGIIHDQGHLEVCVDYLLPSKEAISHTYKADFYFFIPKVMAISSSSYPREQFYGDLMNYIRAHTPHDPSLDLQLIQMLSAYIKKLTSRRPFLKVNQKSSKTQDETPEKMIQRVKLFGNTLNKSLKDAYEHFQQDPLGSLRRLIEVYEVLGEYRVQCVEKTSSASLDIPQEFRRTIRLVDEYLSNRLETAFAEVNRRMSQIDVGVDKNCFKNQVIAILQAEIAYRREQGERFYTKKTSESEKEYFYYRQSLLKKFVAQPLFLDIKKIKQDRRYRNAIASVGAALAGVWSQLADHHAYRAAKATDLGFQFVAVAGFAVLIYVFKDRIKDVSKEYVNEKLKDHIPDFKSVLSHQDLGQIGTASEFVRYLDEKALATEVRFLRRLEGRWDVETPSPDTVLHYHRTVVLEGQSKKDHSIGITEIKDILRFNFSYFLKHLDDPFKQFAAFEQDDRATIVNAPKVYHLNIVIRLSAELDTAGKGPKKVDFERYRLIFNRYGIIRMESLGEKQPLFYIEGEA